MSANYMDQFNDVYASAKNSGGGGGNYNQPQVRDHQAPHTIVRLVGPPRQIRRAWITVAKDKNMPFTFSKTSVLQEIINHVLSFEWVNKGTEQAPKWERKFKYEAAYGDVFDMVRYNGTGDPKNAGWEGSVFYPFNCIDRMDNWCKENKHTKLLVKSPYDLGMSAQAFISLKEDVIADYGEYQDYDIDIKKIIGDQTKYAVKKADPGLAEIGHLVVVGKITPEEEAYTRYDLEEICADTPNRVILKYLGESITKIDKKCGTDFLTKLKAAAAAEPAYTGNSNTSPENHEVPTYVASGLKTPEGFSYDDMIGAGWTASQLAAHPTYAVLVKKVEPVIAPPSAAPSAPIHQPVPTPAAPPSQPVAPPVAPTPVAPSAPVMPEEPKTPEGFTYKDMRTAGWSDAQLLATPQYIHIVPKPVVAPTPVAPPMPMAPPVAPPVAPTPVAPSAPVAPPSSGGSDLLPCSKCGVPYSILESKCPACGHVDAVEN